MMNPIRIFISSVRSEFAKERQALYEYIRGDALLGQFFDPFLFEARPAENSKSQDVFLRAAEDCDIYVGLWGAQYGNAPKNGLSPTEMEYDAATKKHRYRIVFVKNLADGEVRDKREGSLIRKAERDIVRKKFSDYEELRSSLYAALVRYLEEKEIIRHTPFDATFINATIDDIDSKKVKWWLNRARGKRGLKLSMDDGVESILKHLNLMGENGRLTASAILLFGKDPQKFFITSEVKCLQFYGTTITKPIPAYQVYHGTVFEMIDLAVDFVMSRIDARVGDRSKSTEVDVTYELPLDAVREAIVNAVTHRDYTSNGSVQVMLFRDRLEIWNPGRLPYGMTVEKLATVHKSVPTNPVLANPIYLAGYIERIGSGTTDIIKLCEECGLATPVFEDAGDFTVVLKRSKKSVVGGGQKDGQKGGQKSGQKQPDEMTSADKILNCIRENPSVTRNELVQIVGISSSAIQKHINNLKEKGSIRRIGGDRGGHWEVLD